MKWVILIVAVISLALLATRDLWLPGRSPMAERAIAAEGFTFDPAPPITRAGCGSPAWAEASRQNAVSFTTLEWSPFGVAEQGWDAYAPAIAREVGTACEPHSPGFAAALAAWQGKQGLPATGMIEPATVEKMRIAWMLRRPFVIATRSGECPAPLPESYFVSAAPAEGYWGKAVSLRPGALTAYRQMREAAVQEVPGARSDPNFLTIVSAYRSPVVDEAKCLAGGCGGPARARCSAHRTGMALDLHIGAAPGMDVTSSSDANRSFQAGTPVYQWLVLNAERFGFTPYPYEPWHWEWTGEPVIPG